MMLVCSKLPPTSHAGGWGVGSVQDRAQREHPPEQGPAGTEEVYLLDPAAQSWVQEMNQTVPQVTGRGLLPPAPGSPVPANTHPWAWRWQKGPDGWGKHGVTQKAGCGPWSWACGELLGSATTRAGVPIATRVRVQQPK